MKYLLAAISFVFVFLAVTFLVSLGLAIIFRPDDGKVHVLASWRGWVAMILALLAAVQSAKSSLNK